MSSVDCIMSCCVRRHSSIQICGGRTEGSQVENMGETTGQISAGVSERSRTAKDIPGVRPSTVKSLKVARAIVGVWVVQNAKGASD